MEPIRTFQSKTVILPIDNVDTDQIIPARFLRTTERKGLGKSLFADRPEFLQGQSGTILVAGENFGCGSSREHAPWALADYGFRSIIASSFADIFYGNCCQNGLLPVTLPEAQISELFARAAAAPNGYDLTGDLERQRISDNNGFATTFAVDDYRRDMLLKGLDEIGKTLLQEDRIAAYERRRRVS